MKRKRFLCLGVLLIVALCGLASVSMLKAHAAGMNGSWTATGDMTTGGSRQKAVRLQNGKVLVVGGYDGSHYMKSAELYDPATGSWTATGSLMTGRVDFTATLLANGKVLVAGGDSVNGREASAELYDPASGTWSATGSMKHTRDNFAAVLRPDGKVLVAGGFEYSLREAQSSAEVYDPSNGTWVETSDMPDEAAHNTLLVLLNGKVLMVGENQYVAHHRFTEYAVEALYDPVHGTWTKTNQPIATHDYPTATLLPSGKVLMIGQDEESNPVADIYDPASGTWSATEAPAYPTGNLTVLRNGMVLFVNGTDAELYDPAAGTWSKASSPATAHYNGTSTLLLNGQVLLAGGYDGTKSNTSAELFSYQGMTTPLLYAPQSITVNATSLNGAVVKYNVWAENTDAGAVTITCTPPSGTLFPSRITIVQCRGIDPNGNVGRTSIRVTVNGESYQIGQLIRLVDSFQLQPTLGQSLDQKLKQARNVLNQANEGPACGYIVAFSQQVSSLSATDIPTDQAKQLLDAATNIRSVLGCAA